MKTQSMKHTLMIWTLAVLTTTAQLGVAVESADERDARMQWWREAKFGMFVHSGIYSVIHNNEGSRQAALQKRGEIPHIGYQAGDYTLQMNPEPGQWKPINVRELVLKRE